MIMDEPRTNDDWLQLKLDVGRLFSAAPLSQGHGTRENLYTGRASEVRVMMHAVRDPAKHVLLYGERGLGKTSLANAFWRNNNTLTQPLFAARVQVYPFDDFLPSGRERLRSSRQPSPKPITIRRRYPHNSRMLLPILSDVNSRKFPHALELS